MWTMSEIFKQTLRQEHQYATKVALLDTNFLEVEGGTLFSANQTNEITNFISDGNVDVDYTRATRRTAELTLLNPTAEFTPATDNFDPYGPWVGKIYLNRIVRIYRGLYIVDNPVYVPVGTFMIDNTEVMVERNMSLVVLTMSDLWKKIAKSFTLKPINYAEGTPITLIVREILVASGADSPLAPVMDNLDSRTAEEKTLQKKLTLEEGTSRGDWLKERAKEWDIDVYFDPMGRFNLQDRRTAKDKKEVWSFYSDPNKTGMLTSVRRAFNDDNVYNHVIVVGGGETPIRRERVDRDPRSKLNVDLIGDRVWVIKDDKIKTAARADKALNKAWDIRFQISETIQAETVCNPALEADDVVRIIERDYAKVDAAYRLNQFTIPLVSSKQVIQVTNILKESSF